MELVFEPAVIGSHKVLNTDQLVEGDHWAIFTVQEPPGSSCDSCGTNISWKRRTMLNKQVIHPRMGTDGNSLQNLNAVLSQKVLALTLLDKIEK